MWDMMAPNMAPPAIVRVTTLIFVLCLCGQPAFAQESSERDRGWGDVSNVTAFAAGVGTLLMPRVYYSSPEATVGWKARWHVSVLAPVMTQATLALTNELVLKDAFADPRPGCATTAPGQANCETFGLLSTQSQAASGAFGQGAVVFLVDTLKHSRGRFHFGSFAGNVLFPLTMTGVSTGGRLAGNYESPAQVFGSLGVGVVSGAVMGLIYGALQEPECGYSGHLICW